MLDAVKRFATKVLLLHLVLLAVVIFGVVLGTRQVYTGAQREAQEESAARLEVIGKQTSAAIETQYQSIVSDMGILLRNASAATQPATQPEQTAETKAGAASTQPGVRQRFNRFNGRGGARAVAAMFASMGGQPVNDTMVNDMWKQLQGRISQLFVVDNQTGEVTMSLPSDEEGTAQALATAHLEWFKGLKSASMKAFAKTNGSEEDAGYHLLAIPTVWTDLRGGRGFGQGGRGAGAATRAARGEESAGTSDEEGGSRGPGYGLGRGGRQGRGFGPGMRGGPGGGGWGMGGDPNGPGPRGGFGGPGFPPPGGEEEGGPGGPGGGGGGPAMGQEDMGGGGGGGPGAAGGRQGWRELPFNGGGGGPQAGAPQLPTIDARTVVAVLSLDKVRADFFDPLNHERGAPEADANGNVPDASVVNAMLVDQKGDVLVSISGRWVGTNMMTDLDAGMRDAIAPYIQEGKKGSYVMTGDARLGKETLPARIIWFEPVDLPSGQTWTVMTMSPVADVDALVNRLFSSAFQWAVFVSVAVAGILFSSSVFMIRSRVRLERAQHEVITKELQQARNIQLAWLPGEGETPEGIDVSAVNLPASHISGDFYNWFALDGAGKGKVAVVIGDVTGHGMAAAFLMATTQLLVKVALQRTQDPGACLGIVNKQLCTQGFSGQFVTMIVVVLEPGSGAVEVATAGHPAPLLQRGGEFSVMEVVPSLVLGVDAAETYKTHGFVAEPGATMILYTDGVVEAECEDGEQYGVERLVEAVNRGAAKTGGTGRPDQRIKTIVEDVRKFCGAKDLLDDLTVVAVRVG